MEDFMSLKSRQSKEAVREQFTVERIEAMVHTFYTKIQAHDELGPIFEARVEHWPVHMERMVLFWRAVLRAEPTFRPSERGSPPHLHWQMQELETAHFHMWIELFAKVASEVFEPAEALKVQLAAQRIARTLSRHLPEPYS